MAKIPFLLASGSASRYQGKSMKSIGADSLVNFKVSAKDRAKIVANAKRHTKGKISLFIRLVATAPWSARTMRRLKHRAGIDVKEPVKAPAKKKASKK